MLKKTSRLQGESNFKEVYTSRKYLSSPHFSLHFDFKSDTNSRCAAVIPNNVVNKAHKRNELRRRIFHTFGEHQINSHDPLRIIITGRKGIEKLTFAEMQAELTQLLDRVRY